jgi:hypothetical protein
MYNCLERAIYNRCKFRRSEEEEEEEKMNFWANCAANHIVRAKNGNKRIKYGAKQDMYSDWQNWQKQVIELTEARKKNHYIKCLSLQKYKCPYTYITGCFIFHQKSLQKWNVCECFVGLHVALNVFFAHISESKVQMCTYTHDTLNCNVFRCDNADATARRIQ